METLNFISMKVARIITSFMRYTDANLEAKAESIVAAMTGNANYPNPTPLLTEVTDKINAYSTALAAALEGSRTQVALKNEARQQLEETLRQLGAYVTLTANADKTVLITSGFDLAKEPEPRPAITAPKNLLATSGPNSGEIQVKTDAVKGAASYSHEYKPDSLAGDNGQWQAAISTCRKHVFTGLLPGHKYWFRVAAIGTRQQKVYSTEIACIAR